MFLALDRWVGGRRSSICWIRRLMLCLSIVRIVIDLLAAVRPYNSMRATPQRAQRPHQITISALSQHSITTHRDHRPLHVHASSDTEDGAATAPRRTAHGTNTKRRCTTDSASVWRRGRSNCVACTLSRDRYRRPSQNMRAMRGGRDAGMVGGGSC